MKYLLSSTTVHPTREVAVRELLARTESAWDIVQGIIDAEEWRENEYAEQRFYI